MKLFIIFFIVFLALASLGLIFYISTRNKCTLPVKSNCGDTPALDGYPKLPMCTDPDGTPTCELQTKVCGSKPDCVGSLSCDYKTKKWTCSGSGGGGGTQQYCTLTDNKVDYSIFIDGNDTESKTVVNNALQYTLQSFPGSVYGCVLSACTKDYHVSNKETEEGVNGWCVPDQYTGGHEGCKGDDASAVYTYAYDSNKTGFCKFKNCKEGTSGNPCTPTQTNCQDAVLPITGWSKDTNSGTCYVTGCDTTGIKQYTIDSTKQKCVLDSCNDKKDKQFIWGLNSEKSDCVKTGCKPTLTGVKYNLVGDDCQPDCTDDSTVNYFLTGSSATTDPLTNKPIKYFKAHLSTDRKLCVQTNDGSIWGGCGSFDNPSFAIDPDNKTTCKQTVSTQFATFISEENADKDNSAGCVLCQPKFCPLGATESAQCVGVDTECGDTGVFNHKDNTSESALDYCVSQHLDQSFGPYTENLIYKGNKTPGRPIKRLKFLFSTDVANNNIAIYTIDHDDNLTLVRQAPTQGTISVNPTPWYSFNTDSPYYVITTENDFLYDNNWKNQSSKWWYVSTDELYNYMANNNKKLATIVLDFSGGGFFSPDSVAIYKGVIFDNDKNLSLVSGNDQYNVLTCCDENSQVCRDKKYKKSNKCQWW